jgi:cephalosporin hydroxylase
MERRSSKNMNQEWNNFKEKYTPSTPKIDWLVPKIEGWQSESVALLYALDQSRPKTIVEVGTWLGASAIFMTENSQAEIIAVDTFLGSGAVLWQENNVQNLTTDFTRIYNQFCANITYKDLNSRISPLPMTSSSAAELFVKEGVRFDMAYIDAGHQEREVYADLQDWWPMVDKVLVGDDYSPTWPGVIKAADRFANENNLKLQIMDSKFLLWR